MKNTAEETKEATPAVVDYLTPLKSVKIKSVLEGALAMVTVEMVYYNPNEDSSIECTYEVPIEMKTLISSLKI